MGQASESKLQQAILITGAGQRVGQYLAEQFLTQTDFPVVFTYRTLRPGVQQLLDKGAVGLQVDFLKEEEVTRLEQFLTEQVASLRALIHNASIWAKETDLVQRPNLLAEMFSVHVEIPYRLNYFCHPLLTAGPMQPTDIISITDQNIGVGLTHQIGYSATKAALHDLTPSFANLWAPNIKVNEIQPGLVVFNDEDSAEYRQNRLQKMKIPLEPGMDIIWQSVYYLMQLPNTTGRCIKL